MKHTQLDLQSITPAERGKRYVNSFFHPIINLKTREIIGVEALARFFDPESLVPLPPNDIFDKAETDGTSVELDRLCRFSALNAFKSAAPATHLSLFVNMNASILNDPATRKSGTFMHMTEQAGLTPAQVAIEVVEARVNEPRDLIEFSTRYREAGYLIVVDDFGSAHSNLERLIDIKPDIIKIDKSIIRNIDTDHYKQSILKSIAEMSRMIGALSLAEGVETLSELAVCFSLGADLFQGYLFGKPGPDFRTVTNQAALVLYEAFRRTQAAIAEETARLGESIRRYKTITACAFEKLAGFARSDPAGGGSLEKAAENCFDECLAEYPGIACLFLLDERGVQLTSTVCRDETTGPRVHYLFQPAPRGADHALKPYYRFVRMHGECLTDPYISLATGNLCRTAAKEARLADGREVILCIDFEDGI